MDAVVINGSVVDGSSELTAVGSGRGIGVGNGLGDFYAPGVPTMSPYTNDGPTINGVWQVSAGSVQIVGSGYITPAEGSQALDLDGTTPGTIYQDISTTPGQQHAVTSDLAGNTDSGSRKAQEPYARHEMIVVHSLFAFHHSYLRCDTHAGS